VRLRKGLSFAVAAATASKADLCSHHYNLAVDIFTLSAEYESYAGRIGTSYEMVDVVLAKATNLEDKLRAYYVRLYGLTCEERLVEAVHLGLELLDKLGEKVKRRLSTFNVVTKTMQISWLMRRRGAFDVGTMNEMSNWKTICSNESIEPSVGHSLVFG
jgi:hypothetical protein